jgi:hypothetical protein
MTVSPKLHVLFSIFAAGWVSLGCSGPSNEGASDAGTSTGLCPSDIPALSPDGSCPMPTPSYQTDIVPILERDCIPCHGPTGTAGHDETTYAEVANQAGPIFDQVSACLMPTAGSPQLTATERLTLLDWLVCSAPDN